MEGGDARGGTKAGYEEEDEGLDDDGGGGCCWGGAGAVTARNPGFSKERSGDPLGLSLGARSVGTFGVVRGLRQALIPSRGECV